MYGLEEIADASLPIAAVVSPTMSQTYISCWSGLEANEMNPDRDSWTDKQPEADGPFCLWLAWA